MTIALELRLDGADETSRRFGRLARALADTTPVMQNVGRGLVDNTRERVRAGRDPTGKAFRPLNPGYAATKRGAGILRATGALMGSLTVRAWTAGVEVGTSSIYGRIHQYGGTIVPKAGARLVFTLGKRMIFATQVTIPARPYLGIDAADRTMILDTIDEALARALARR
jgi:phage virion morphogenesis protein